MAETYTYTARNADKPEEVYTFTLRGNFLHLTITGLLEQIEKVRKAEQKGEEVRRQIQTQGKSIALKMIESFSGPVHISDTSANFADDGIMVLVWKRMAGFRLAPMLIKICRVDNSEAASAFVEELNERKANAPHAGRFFGPLDYWLGWVGLILIIAALIRWPHRNT